MLIRRFGLADPDRYTTWATSWDPARGPDSIAWGAFDRALRFDDQEAVDLRRALLDWAPLDHFEAVLVVNDPLPWLAIVDHVEPMPGGTP